jgi:hypothetical protein
MNRQLLLDKLLRFAGHTTLCFILFSLILALKHGLANGASDMWTIHSGLLQDLTADYPMGRQGLVGFLSMMPLSSLAALPFLPFLDPSAYGYGWLYGQAALLALAALPLGGLLRRVGAGRLQAAAPLLLALTAYLLGSTAWADLLPCLAMLILAAYFETRELAELRALAGVFWALALFAHAAGLALALLRALWPGFRRSGGRPEAEARAVRWIRRVSILYGLGIYLFLNWMILGTPLYPFVTAPWWRLPGGDPAASRAQLARLLAQRYPDCRPVVSGLWGYTVLPLLDATEGYHVMDFHPGKLPADETGSLVLVLPAGRNPFAALGDVKPGSIRMDESYASVPVFASTPDWTFVRLELKNSE